MVSLLANPQTVAKSLPILDTEDFSSSAASGRAKGLSKSSVAQLTSVNLISMYLMAPSLENHDQLGTRRPAGWTICLIRDPSRRFQRRPRVKYTAKQPYAARVRNALASRSWRPRIATARSEGCVNANPEYRPYRSWISTCLPSR